MNDIETRLAALADAVPSPAAPPRAAYDAAHRGWGGPAMTPRPAGHGAGPRAAAVPGAGCAPPYPSRAWPRSGGLLVAIMPRGSAPTPTGPAAADVVSALRTAPVADRGVRAAGLGFPGVDPSPLRVLVASAGRYGPLVAGSTRQGLVCLIALDAHGRSTGTACATPADLRRGALVLTGWRGGAVALMPDGTSPATAVVARHAGPNTWGIGRPRAAVTRLPVVRAEGSRATLTSTGFAEAALWLDRAGRARPATVPDLSGLPVVDAGTVAMAARVADGAWTPVRTDGVAAGTVMDQSVAAGEEVSPGTPSGSPWPPPAG